MKRMTTITVGETAPIFTLPDQHGTLHRLSDYHGEWVLLYFYPKDGTSGCTEEACAMRDIHPNFTRLNSVIFGISADSTESHSAFAKKHRLPFTLLSDIDKSVLKDYGVWQKKNVMGKSYWGTVRTSFLINPQGRIEKIYSKVRPAEHAGEVLADIKRLQTH